MGQFTSVEWLEYNLKYSEFFERLEQKDKDYLIKLIFRTKMMESWLFSQSCRECFEAGNLADKYDTEDDDNLTGINYVTDYLDKKFYK